MSHDSVIMKPVLKAVLGETTSLPIDKGEEGKIIVFSTAGTTNEDIKMLSDEIGARILTADSEIGKYTIALPPTISVEDAQQFYKTSFYVDFALPNFIGIATARQIPNDAYFSSQWAMDNTQQTGGRQDADIDAPETWSIQTGSRNIIVAVLDSGVNSHPDLVSNLFTNPAEIPNNGVDDDNNGYVDDVKGWNTVFHYQDSSGKYVNGKNITDVADHGTDVAGIIGAVGNNGSGIAGVNWQVTTLPVKVLDDYGYGTIDAYIDGIRYAIKMGAQILNASLVAIITNPDNKTGLFLHLTGLM